MSASAEVAAPRSSVSPAPARRRSLWGGRLDTVLMALVLLFAFLAGSFVARNSDLWLHLATGRLLASGEYRFGVDPFAYTTAGQYWANHAWLFDLGLYLGFQWFGGPALVVFKALTVAAIAGVMLLTVRRKAPGWLGTGCVLVAILAMSPRLLLQPTVASLLLLALCVRCLQLGGRKLVIVPVLIAVWVNLDGWFILGPAVVLLFWVGRRLEPLRAFVPPWPQWFIPVSLLACLLSPHHIRAFTLPTELSPAVWGSAFQGDPRFAGLFASPWHWGPLGAVGGYNLAAWAYLALLALGVVSFTLNRRALRSWRATVWLPFALLAAWQSRLIPFFAVVAGPITALNFGEVVPRSLFLRVGRGLVLAGALALVGLGWLGLTNGFHNRDRGVAWAIHTDRTMEKAAQGLTAWRTASETRIFPTHPDLGHYLSWFAPGEKCFLDSRLPLFTGVADDFMGLSRDLGLFAEEAATPLGERFHRYELGAVLLYDPDAGRMTRGLRSVVGENRQWDVVRIDGGAALLVTRTTPGSRFEAEQTAFGAGSEWPTAGDGPAQLAEPKLWWERGRGLGRTGSWQADSAGVCLRLFELGATNSPAFPLLSVRAARAGSEADPSDATAWLLLGRAYLTLGERTWEREAGDGLSPLGHIRLVQATTALVQAVLLNPDSLPTREALMGVFARRRALDLAQTHAAAAVNLIRRAGQAPGESSEAYAERVQRAAVISESLENAVLDSENRFLVRTSSLTGDPLGRARIAAELGLVQKAIDVLLRSHPDLYGTDGLRFLTDLLLQTGQAAEARVLLDRAELRRNPGALGTATVAGKPHPSGHQWSYQFHAYDWLDLCQCAAAGRYDGAARAAERLRARYEADEQTGTADLAKDLIRMQVFEAGLGVPPQSVLGRLFPGALRTSLSDTLAHRRFLAVARADLTTLSGVLELERGNVAAAAGLFEAALGLYPTGKGVAPVLPGEPLARRYHEAIRSHR